MLDAQYTVQPADETEGLAGIAHRLYGDVGRWVEIYDANRGIIGNNPYNVQSGQQLIIPNLNGRHTAGGGAQVYVVQPSDMHHGLRGLARRLLGDPEQWSMIYAINRGVIGDVPDRLQAGQRLILLHPAHMHMEG